MAITCIFIAGDNGESPAITALDTHYESGSAYDRVLNIYSDSLFAMLKYNSGDSKLKLYAPADMSCSAEFSTGLAGVYAVSGICRRDTDAYCLLVDKDGVYRQARCAVTVTDGAAKPALTVSEDTLPDSRVIARGEGVVYAVSGTALYVLDAETLELLATEALPGTPNSYLCALDGAALGELWGGKYIPAGSWLVDVSDMSSRALRCDGSAVEGYAVHPAAGRYFAAHADSKWYLFDSLLRPVWGMVPYVTASESVSEELPEVDMSAYGSMTRV